MAEVRSAAEVARALADALEAARLPYAIGGAIALGYHSAPRATIDVDVNVFVDPSRALDTAMAALARAGFSPEGSPAILARQAMTDGQFRGHVSTMRVDVFVPAIPYYAELRRRRRSVILSARPIWILGANDLAVLKLMFFRTKDLADVEALLRSPEARIDRGFVRRKLVRLLGRTRDERVRAWDSMVKQVSRTRTTARR